MKMDQPTHEVKGIGCTMSPALEAHLADMHGRAMYLQFISVALEVLMETGAGDAKITGDLASVVADCAVNLSRGLDGATLARVMA